MWISEKKEDKVNMKQKKIIRTSDGQIKNLKSCNSSYILKIIDFSNIHQQHIKHSKHINTFAIFGAKDREGFGNTANTEKVTISGMKQKIRSKKR